MRINLIFSFDENYIKTFKILLYSIYLNHPDEIMTIYLLHYDMNEELLNELDEEITQYSYHFRPLNCRRFLEESDSITINRYYTVEMYLWLFAPYILPEEVKRALYLDPDIINLNSIQSLYYKNFDGNLFVATDYEVKNKIIQPINNLRLGTTSAEHYFNAGVVLMNIEKLRTERKADEIVEAILENKSVLILPDQDIFNLLYHGEIKVESWELYNMDPRLYQLYQLLMSSEYSKDWVEKHVVFIHYAGKNKPWIKREAYRMDLGRYYFEYETNYMQFKQERERERIND